MIHSVLALPSVLYAGGLVQSFCRYFSLNDDSMTKIKTTPAVYEKNSLTIQQWIVLAFSFLLGIAAVLTVDKLFIADSMPTGSVHAAISHP